MYLENADPLNNISNDYTYVSNSNGERITNEIELITLGGNNLLATFQLANWIGVINERRAP